MILDVVTALLESNGYDKWQLDDVAEGARVSLATIYKHFPSRGELTVAALERWMEIHAYGPIESRAPGEPLFDALIRMLRTIFEPWEKHPEMLDAFIRARWAVGGGRLRSQGDASVEAMREAFDRAGSVRRRRTGGHLGKRHLRGLVEVRLRGNPCFGHPASDRADAVVAEGAGRTHFTPAEPYAVGLGWLKGRAPAL